MFETIDILFIGLVLVVVNMVYFHERLNEFFSGFLVVFFPVFFFMAFLLNSFYFIRSILFLVKS